jgi:SEC-C motif-containing protein
MAKSRARRAAKPEPCPCGQRLTYERCCGPLHAGAAAVDPVALMRSRYSAYARGLVDYVVATTDPEGEAWGRDEAAWREDVAAFCAANRFEGVDVIEARVDGAGEGGQGWVTFRARLRQGSADATFVERSRFVLRGGRWLYSADEGPPD